MKKILIVFGTRPEAIKMVSLIKEFQLHKTLFEMRVCITAQHRQMLDQVLDVFQIIPEYDLNIMKPNQNLFDVTSNVLLGLKDVFDDFSPDLILVHGDTTTTLSASLAAFYQQISIGHVEAGLRTYNLKSPWPEEANRQITTVLADFHFSPTKHTETNLLNAGISKNNILITGNTVIDALRITLDRIKSNSENEQLIVQKFKSFSIIFDNRRKVLITGHRRECFGQGIINICEAILELSDLYQNVDFIYPVHLNPNINNITYELLSGKKNIYLISPLQYEEFVYLMEKSYLIITDSGGIQEEAPSLGIPVLVTRETTERPEAVEAGTVRLVGTNKTLLVSEAKRLLNDELYYNKISMAYNPYGDGTAAKKIISFLKNKYL